MTNPISNKPMTKKPIHLKPSDSKREHPFASTKVSSMRGHGGDRSEKDKVFKYGQMVLGIRDNGQMTRQTGKESSFMWMETSTRVTGRMTRLRALGLIITIMVQSISENGLTIFNTEKALKRGLTVANTKDSTIWEKKMGEESISGRMAASMMEIGSKTKLQGLGYIFGQMGEDMRVSG